MSSSREKANMVSLGQARGKAILLGEHAVVYGVPALVAGLEVGARARATIASELAVDWVDERLPASDPLYEALARLTAAFNAPPVHLRLELALPSGMGLGASAALGVAAARAVRELGTRPSEPLSPAVDAWERVFHGNPSGVDAAAAELGGVLRFVRGEKPVPLELKTSFDLCVCLAAPPASTKEMVEQVRRGRDQDPAAFQAKLDEIGQLVDAGALALSSGDLDHLGALMSRNHEILRSFQLSTGELEKARELALEAGALGAKLTGSGGGGALIALGDPRPILSAWKTQGFDGFCSRIGGSPT